MGNKSDLPRERRKVPKEMVSNYVYYELPRLRTKVSWAVCGKRATGPPIELTALGSSLSLGHRSPTTDHRLSQVIECSCKENTNIETIFRSYLSLARVSLSTTVIIQNKASNCQHHHSSLTSKKRPGSALAGGDGPTSDGP